MSNADIKQDFIGRARALSNQPEVLRSALMTALIADSVGFGVPAEADYFAAAYGDPTGRDYWDAHLSEPVRVGAFAYLLSVHLPLNPEQLVSARIAITLAFRNAAAAGERLFVGDIAPLLCFERPKYDFDILMNVMVLPRAAASFLLSKPKCGHLMPESLRDFIEAGSAAFTKPRRLSRKSVESFVDDYINSEKAAGRSPKLSGLEDAAKKAGLHGGREHLREAFHRKVVVKEGRPSKLAK